MKGKRRNINRLTVSRSLEGRSFYEKCENPRHITVYTSDTNNGDIIQIILSLISFSFYFKKLLLLRIYWVKRMVSQKCSQPQLFTARGYKVLCGGCRRRSRAAIPPLHPSTFARHLPHPLVISPQLQEFQDWIISDIQSSEGRDSIIPATQQRDGDHSSYWLTFTCDQHFT